MTNLIPELEKPEDRRGVAPFEEGIIRSNSGYGLHIKSPEISFGSLGNISLGLTRWRDPEENFVANENAFTVDQDGRVSNGDPIKLTKEGYSELTIEIKLLDMTLVGSPYKMKIKLWINKTDPLFESELFAADHGMDEPDPWAHTHRWSYEGKEGFLMSKDNEELLKSIRVSVEGNGNV